MYKIIALCGESGAGKDRTLHEIFNMDQERFSSQFHKIINCTTRPPREGEIEGVHYHFMTPAVFADYLLHNTMLEATEHRDWFYGTTIDALSDEKVNIGVFNPIAIDILAEDPRVELKVYKIAASPKTRMLRQLNRVSNPDVDEIVRRYSTDKKDFAEMETPYVTLINETDEDLYNNIIRISQEASLGNFE